MTAKFVVLLRAAWIDALAYRAQLFIWVTTGMLPLIMLAIWRTLAGDGTIGGYARDDFVAYFVGALCIRQLTGVWIIWDMEREIRLGELSPHLLRPVHPLWRYLAMALADKPLRLLMMAPIVLIAGLIAPGAIPQPDLLRWSLLPLAIGLAFTVYFLNQCCIGVLSFWWTQVLALQDFLVWRLRLLQRISRTTRPVTGAGYGGSELVAFSGDAGFSPRITAWPS
jgi:ABC-2 type transport system permease protein